MGSSGLKVLGAEDFLLLGAVSLLPWAFGGVEPWAHRSAALAIVAAAAIVVSKRGVQAVIGPLRQRWLLPAVFLAGWAAFQLVPLPATVIRLVSPETYRVHAMTESITIERAVQEPRQPNEASRSTSNLCSTFRPLSLVPQATRDRLLWFVPLLLAFVMLRQRMADRRRRRIYRTLAFVSLAGLAGFALVQAATWNGKILWTRPLLSGANPFGPYMNPVHFAGLMELAVPVMLGAAWARARRSDSSLALLRDDRFILNSMGTLLCAAAGIASSSKAAMLLIPGSVLVLVLVVLRSNRNRLIAAGLAAMAGVGSVGLVWDTPVLQRTVSYMQRTQPGHWLEGRGAVWVGGLDMLAAFPVAGTGFGTFREVFPRYLPAGSPRRWAQAHNDYLESVTDGGLVAGVALALLIGFVASKLIRRLRGRRDKISIHHAGMTIGLATLALHATLDFNHQIPANALFFVMVCAMALKRRSSVAFRVPQPRRMVSVALAALLIVFAFHAAMGVISGLRFSSGQPLIDPDNPDPAWVRMAAMQTDPAALLYERASISLDEWDLQADEVGVAGADPRLLDDAAGAYAKAHCDSPAAWQPWVGLAYVHKRRALVDAEARPDSMASPGHEGLSAIKMMRNAVARAPNWYVTHDQLVRDLWDYGLRQESLEAVRASAAALPFYWHHSFGRDEQTPDEIRAAFAEGSWSALDQVPLIPAVDQLIALGKLERLRGDDTKAEKAFLLAREERGDALNRAEAAYHLGLIAQNRQAYAEARPLLKEASQHPSFHGPALRQLVLVAEVSGAEARSLELLQTISREEPENLEIFMQLAAKARQSERWSVAIDALFHADAIRPEDPGASTALVETYLSMGNANAARFHFDIHRSRHPDDPDIERLARALADAETAGG